MLKSKEIIHQYFFVIRWIVFLLIGTFIFLEPTMIEIVVNDQSLYLIISSSAYLVIISILFFVFKRKAKIYFAKAIIFTDLLWILLLMFLSDGWTSIFVTLLLVWTFYFSKSFSRLGGILTLILTLIGYLMIGFVVNDFDYNQLQMLISIFHVVLLIITFFIGNYSGRKELGDKYVPNTIKEQSLIEPITGLYNHRSFHNTLYKFSAMEQPFALIVADISGFKKINEKYGYAVGDQILSTYGHTLLYFQKDQNYYSFRYRDDQFFIILFESKERHIQNYIHLWNNLFEDSLKQILELNNEQVIVNYGVTLKTKATNKNVLIDRAEAALTIAKQSTENIYFNQGEERE